jgi:cation diffusion facilitator CzcD-associated flavoprotein CzcO
MPQKETVMTVHATSPSDRQSLNTTVDAVVVGAGFAGMYMLHCLREMGLDVMVLEAGGSVGGTWYWNRYPGARCDIESMQYSYSFSEALDQEWTWSEKYSPQPEILAYAEHVAQRYDLKRDIRFDTRVEAARFEENTDTWVVSTDRGDTIRAQFCVMALGCLSAANKPAFEGIDSFEGDLYHTGEWPHEEVDFRGQRVAVIGTGSSAIQSIPIIASQASELTVFQRTASYTVPAWNESLSEEYVASVKATYPELRAKARARPTGFYFPFNTEPALEATEDEREVQYEEAWQRGGLPFLGAYGDLLFEKEANDTVAKFARQKIRGIVKDPATAELLSPDNVFGCKRLCVDTGYFAVYNEPHVSLVDVSKQPIERFTSQGLVAAGQTYEFDAVVCATGFEAMTGSFDRMEITGLNGLTLKDKWSAGPRTYLGVASAGFPNLFMVTGPGSPSVLANMVQAIEQHVDWMVDCIAHLRQTGTRRFEVQAAAEDEWVAHVNEVSEISLRSTCSSWYVGANVPGKPRVFMPYIGGFPIYVNTCNEVMNEGYRGFNLDGRKSGEGPSIRWTKRWQVPLDMDVISPAMIAARRVPLV